MLFSFYGVDSESVTIIVTAFMIGLGVGSLCGGWCSRKLPQRTLELFGVFELSIGVFGLLSLGLFDWVAAETLHVERLTMGLITFGLVLIPTTLMGATLPLLVDFASRRTGNVGRSVGVLYFVNTFGAALGSGVAALFLLGLLGLSGSVYLAAGLNIGLGLFVLLYVRKAEMAFS